MFLRRVFRGFLKLGFLAIAGLVAYGGWDYVQTAKASETDYSMQDHLPILLDRYESGARQAINMAGPMIDTAVTYVQESEIAAQWGLDTGVITQATGSTAPVSTAPLEQIDVASVTRVGAPEQSLYPRARALQEAPIQR